MSNGNIDIIDLLPPENRLLWGADDGVKLRKRRASNKHVEGEIQSAILKYLSMRPDVAWAHRMNVGAMKLTDQSGKQRFVRFGFTGCSDIIGQLNDGRFLAIEVKSPSGRVSAAQTAFLAMVSDNHGVSGVARSVEDVDTILGESNEDV